MIQTSVVPERKLQSPSGSYPPRKPSRTYAPFKTPKEICIVKDCNNFSTGYCSMCYQHCQEHHRGHRKSNSEIEKLIKKYSIQQSRKLK